MSNEQRVRQNFVGGLVEDNPLAAADTVVTDGATNTNTTVTSATAAFVANDVGRPISGGSIPAGATIASVTNATTVVISAAATTTATAVTLTIGRGTFLTSAGLTAVPVIGTTQHFPIVLDPDGLYGAPEVVYVTAHTSAATTATILRGVEGTTARAHNRDVPWTHGPTVNDFGTGLLAYTQYAPAANVTFTSGTASLVALDTTNLSITVVVPPSGKLLVRLSGLAVAAGSSSLAWGLVDGAGVAFAGSASYVTDTVNAVLICYACMLTGLTPGASQVIRWAHLQNTGTGGNTYAGTVGNSTRKLLMEAWGVFV